MGATSSTAKGARGRSLKPLRDLLPYVTRYRAMVAGAVVSLMLAAAMTLALPPAVGRMIDRGFSAFDSSLVANYFMVLGAIAAVLALASACRYYFVVTLGERVVADIRRDVFAHVTRLSPSYFDATRSGDIVTRLTADTTQVKSAIGATASVALRNVILLIGAIAMMVVTSPKLSGLVIVAIPLIVVPLVGFGRSVRRKSRTAQAMLANAMAYAGEQIGSIRTLQAFTNESLVTERFSGAVETAFRGARSSVFARSFLTWPPAISRQKEDVEVVGPGRVAHHSRMPEAAAGVLLFGANRLRQTIARSDRGRSSGALGCPPSSCGAAP